MPDLSDGVNWSEIDADNNQSPPNGWPEGMMPSGVNDAARADKGALKRFWDKINPVQTITSSGNVFTFITGNTAYPTAYVNGEVYSFMPSGASAGGDQFQVNSLGPKPILKHYTVGGGSWIPIIAYDMRAGHAAQLVYGSGFNAGAGGFALLNPVLPLENDGTAVGVSVPGNLTVAGATSAIGYQSRAGTAGSLQANNFNIQWTGTAAHLWIDTIDTGPLATGSTGVIAGNATVGGTLNVSGATTLNGGATISGALTAGSATVNNNESIGGTLSVSGATTLTTLSASGGITSATTVQGQNVNSVGDSHVGNNLFVAGTTNLTGPTTTAQGIDISGTVPGGGGAALYVNGSGMFTSGITVEGPNSVFTQGLVVDTAPGQLDALQVNGGNLSVGTDGNGDSLFCAGNVHISGTLNGHPAVVLDTLTTQLQELTSRIASLETVLEAAREDLRRRLDV